MSKSLNTKSVLLFFIVFFWFLVIPTMSFSSWMIETVDAPKYFEYFYSRAIAIDSFNRPHIAYGGDHLYHAYFDGTQWQYEVVDSAGAVGAFASIAIDSDNKVHISYGDYENNNLKYATNASGSWVTSTIDSSGQGVNYNSIAIDSDNKVHISYGEDNFKYATNASGSWVISTIDTGGFFPSIAVDSDNKVHISYGDFRNYDLKYAYGYLDVGSVSPTSHDFGSVTVRSSSAPQTFTISNTSTATLHFSCMSLSDTANYSLNVNGGTNPCGSTTPTITPDSSCTVTVTFTPTSVGTKDANLTISTDEPDTTTLNVSLSGTGVQQCFNNLNCNSGYYCKKPEGSCYSTGFCTVRPGICPTLFMPVCGCNGVTYPNDCEAALAGVSVAYQGECVLPPTIGYSPTTFSFTAIQGGSNPPSQNLSITNTGGGTLNWSVSDDATWLNLSPLSGSDSGTITLSVNISGLTAGVYNANLTITATGSTNSPVNIPVTLTVNAPATLTLLAPNGGEVIPSGSPYNIMWNTSPEAVKFDLKYSMNNGKAGSWKPIANQVSGTSYNWTVPKPIANKTKCLVKVVGFNPSGMKVSEDKSDAPFKIEVVRVISPNGTESLIVGQPWIITWQTNGTARSVTKAILSYTDNAGMTWKPITTFYYRNPGSYSWTVPWVPAYKGKCKVKVVLKDSGGLSLGTDTSDKYFMISNPG